MATFEDNSPEGCLGCFEEEVEDASCDVDVDGELGLPNLLTLSLSYRSL
ncbi:16457_t:CDS:2 [Rhizophagus irregularis]|nr:16457_t:CDS:2 [Rhizophagus irregularis]